MINETSNLIKIVESKILLVEGDDDERFFNKLIEELEVGGIQTVKYRQIGTKDLLNALKKDSNFKTVDSIGIVGDADTNANSAFQGIADSVRDVGLPVPDRVLASAGDKLKVTIMILPDGKSGGMLEDLCLASVKNDPAMPCVENYFNCLKDHHIPEPNNMPKAKVKAFLASRSVVVPHLGVAAQKGYWPLDAVAFDQVKQFISSL